MDGRPAPIWILGDSTNSYGSDHPLEKDMLLIVTGVACREDYTLIDRRGRFVLLRKKD